ncbi:MAG: nuclear transport factor 2 family protein, partial [Pseudomonadota bacterium]
MSVRTLIAATTAATLIPFTAFADSAASKALVLEALENTLLSGNADAVAQYYAEDYIQHNPDFPDGIEGQKAVVAAVGGAPGFKAEYVRVIADDDIVAVHARYEGFGPKAIIGFDV